MKGWDHFVQGVGVVRHDVHGRMAIHGVDGSVEAIPSYPCPHVFPNGTLVRTLCACTVLPARAFGQPTVVVNCVILPSGQIGPSLVARATRLCPEVVWACSRQHRLDSVEICGGGPIGYFSSRFVVQCSGPDFVGRWSHQWCGDWNTPTPHPLSRTSTVSVKDRIPVYLTQWNRSGRILASACENKPHRDGVYANFDSRICEVDPHVLEVLISERLVA